MSTQFNLNQDQVIYGTVVESRVLYPRQSANGRDVFSLRTEPDDKDLGFRIGHLLEDAAGPHAVNGDDLLRKYAGSDVLTLESIIPPLCSGACGEGGEFATGQRVRVSMRCELSDPVQSELHSSKYFVSEKMMLRFVDADLENDEVFSSAAYADEEDGLTAEQQEVVDAYYCF